VDVDDRPDGDQDRADASEPVGGLPRDKHITRQKTIKAASMTIRRSRPPVTSL
jgi:hypothetical protein